MWARSVKQKVGAREFPRPRQVEGDQDGGEKPAAGDEGVERGQADGRQEYREHDERQHTAQDMSGDERPLTRAGDRIGRRAGVDHAVENGVDRLQRGQSGHHFHSPCRRDARRGASSR